MIHARRCDVPRSAAADFLTPLEPRLVMAQFTTAPAGLFFEPAVIDGVPATGFGYAVAGIGDITGDGREEFAVGAPGLRANPFASFTGDDVGRVFIYDGASNTILRTLQDGSIGFGATLVNVGDVDSDGWSDLAVGSPQWDANDDNVADSYGRVAVFSGASGEVVRFWNGEGRFFGLGAAMAPGDLNGDGQLELVVSATGAGPNLDEVGPGQVFVLSLSTGDALYTLTGENPGDLFGHALFASREVRAEDTAGDGVVDLVIGAPGFGEDAGNVYVYDGPTGTRTYTLGDVAGRTHPGDRYGAAVYADLDNVLRIGVPGGDIGSVIDCGYVVDLRPWDSIPLHIFTQGVEAGRGVGSSITLFPRVDSEGESNYAILFPRIGDQPAITHIFGGGNVQIVRSFSGTIALSAAGDTTVLAQEDGSLHLIPTDATSRHGLAPHLWPFDLGLVSSQGTYSVGGAQAGGVVAPSGYVVYRGIATALSNLPGMQRLYVHAVNELGEMICSQSGSASTIDQYFVYRNGVLVPLAVPGLPPMEGQIGVVLGDGGHVVVHTGPLGTAYLIEDGAVSPLWTGRAMAVNASGLVLGVTNNHAILRLPGGEIVSLPGYFTHGQTYAIRAINDAGQVLLLTHNNDLYRWQNGELSLFSTVTRGGDIFDISLGNNGEAMVRRTVISGGPQGGIPSSSTTYHFLNLAGEDTGLFVNGEAFDPLNFTGFRVRSDGSFVVFGTLFLRDDAAAPSLVPEATLSSADTPDGRLSIVDAIGHTGLDAFDFPVNGPGAGRVSIPLGFARPRSSVAFTDEFTGQVNIIANIGGRLIWFTPQGAGFDAGRELVIGDGLAVLGDIATFTSMDGRVHIAAVTSSGELILVYQLNSGALRTDLSNWAAANVSQTHFAPQDIATPGVASGLAAYSTRWGGMNVVWLDDAGDVRSAWWAPGMLLWREDNLSDRANAPALTGNLAPYLTAWDGINIAGTDAGGTPVTLWWVPQFAATWSAHTFADAPALVPGSLTAYVTPWSGLNIAGVQADGQTTILWWTPSTVDWIVQDLEVDTVVRPRLTSAVDPETGAMTLAAPSSDGVHLVRTLWTPESNLWIPEAV